MKSFTLNELKKELQLLPAKDLADICVSLAKYRKDNKDFLGYLLVDSYDKEGFIRDVKAEMDAGFEDLQKQSNHYYAKKSLRKILRQLTRYGKYLNDKAALCDLLIHFCGGMKASVAGFRKNPILNNLYEQQIKKIRKLIESLHPDLQGDYFRELEAVSG